MMPARCFTLVFHGISPHPPRWVRPRCLLCVCSWSRSHYFSQHWLLYSTSRARGRVDHLYLHVDSSKRWSYGLTLWRKHSASSAYNNSDTLVAGGRHSCRLDRGRSQWRRSGDPGLLLGQLALHADLEGMGRKIGPQQANHQSWQWKVCKFEQQPLVADLVESPADVQEGCNWANVFFMFIYQVVYSLHQLLSPIQKPNCLCIIVHADSWS